MNWYKKAQKDYPNYPLAPSNVSGLNVLTNIPNLSSISSSLDNYTILEGIREVPMSDFNITGKSYSVSENQRISELTKQIQQSQEIAPLIVVIDQEGAYILEGSHRIDALYNLGVKTFPALVVEDIPDRDY